MAFSAVPPRHGASIWCCPHRFTGPPMSNSSATSQQTSLSSAELGEHEATRGVVTAVLFGAGLWCAMIGVLSWALN